MRRNSTSIDTTPQGFARFDKIGRIANRAQLAADRAFMANALPLMTHIDERDRSPGAGQPQGERPLFQGREMGVRWNIGLRLVGMALIGIAAAAISWMYSLVHADGDDPVTFLGYLLALIGFISASVGSALLFLGTHIFDEVEVSARWKPRP